MSALAGSSAILLISDLPDGVDVRWETQRRVVWNERERSEEEHELVYEISWIKELWSLAHFPTVAPQGERLKKSLLRRHSVQ